MHGTDWMIVFMTFITGVAAGSFIYFKGFAEIDFDPNSAVAPFEEIADFEVSVAQYGGCARGANNCPSYRLNNDGSYTFINRKGVSTSGVVSAKLLSGIKEAATSFNFEAHSRKIEPKQCAAFIDANDMSYFVEIDGEGYDLDTCYTALDSDAEFIELLDELLESLLAE